MFMSYTSLSVLASKLYFKLTHILVKINLNKI